MMNDLEPEQRALGPGLAPRAFALRRLTAGWLWPLNLWTFTAMFAVSICPAAGADAGYELLELDSPAPPVSQLSRLTSDESGRVYLSWVSTGDSGATLAYSQLVEKKWTAPRIISAGTDWFINWADFPALSVQSGNMLAHWLRKSAEGTYDYDVVVSFYDQARGDWSSGRVIHDTRVSAEHGFVSMTPMAPELTLISWLDGRNTRTQPEPGPMTLRAGVFDAFGKTVSEWELDGSVCDCCQTDSALTQEGPVVVYRDRSADNIRDIAIVRLVDGRWTPPKVIHDDHWQINGCPVNGPAVAAQGERVAVAWFTAKDDVPKVQVLLSDDSGQSFRAPILVAASDTNGRVGTAILASGEIVVSWVQVQEAGARIMLSRFSREGVLIDTIPVANSNASRRSGFPTIASVGNTAYLSWTDIRGASRIKVAAVVFGPEEAF
jgi:hypothetical protein